jgi:hypothetical protein
MKSKKGNLLSYGGPNNYKFGNNKCISGIKQISLESRTMNKTPTPEIEGVSSINMCPGSSNAS